MAVNTSIICRALTLAAKVSLSRDYGISCLDINTACLFLRTYTTAKLLDHPSSDLCTKVDVLRDYLSCQSIEAVTPTNPVVVSCPISVTVSNVLSSCDPVTLTIT